MYAVREFDDRVPRDAESILCDCGKVAHSVTPDAEEIRKYNCNRSYICCARAFLCECGKRYAMSAEAPDMD
jgi:hypothetical protein